jgi:hypothetical protein
LDSAAFTAIAAGYNFSLFLKNDGTVWGCGNSSYGQLGGSFGSYRVAVQISPLSSIVKIAGGLNHSIFLKNDGTVWACGSNVYGQLGTGSSNTFDNPVPVQMSALGNITQISAGSDYSLFLSADGKVWVCGDNARGQLGVGANAQTTQVATPSRWSDAITSAATVTSVCGSPVNLALTAFRPGSTFTWIAANNPNVTGESSTVQTTGSINDVLINGTSVAQTVSYTVTADACGAMGSTQTVTVTVNPGASSQHSESNCMRGNFGCINRDTSRRCIQYSQSLRRAEHQLFLHLLLERLFKHGQCDDNRAHRYLPSEQQLLPQQPSVPVVH